jgi:hypothetical protein
MFTLGIVLLCFALPAVAQVGPPVNLDFGLGGGVSLPTGTLSDFYKTGYHVGGKVRLHGSLPFNVVVAGFYNSLPEKSTDKSDTQTMISGGLEVAIPSAGVHPYFGADVIYVNFQNEGTGPSSFDRGGLGVGAGVEFTIPAFGSFDTSVKYQFMNIMGKEDGEDTMSQVAATVTVMLGLI